MSDYLWDKTGEADPEVERLESLLGGFAHRPRPLELPAVETRARRAPVWRYAAAAAVLLAVVAGALVAFRLARTGGAGQVVETAPPRVVEPREVVPSITPQPRDEVVRSDEPAPRERRVAGSADKPRRPRRRAAHEGVAHKAPAGGASVAPEVASEGQRLRAKEQLMYALRLTGVKLEEVRRKVQGEDDAVVAPQ